MTEIFRTLGDAVPEWVGEYLAAAIACASAIAIAFIIHRIAFRILRRIAQASESKTDDVVVDALFRPVRYALIAIGLTLAARETAVLGHVWERIAGLVMPAMIGWIALTVIQSLVRAMQIRAEMSPAPTRDQRGRRTRLAIFSRIASFIIVFITVGLMLLSIPGVRDVGVTLMASAGLATLAVGAAAQPALKSLIAGFQMAITEPIRIGDLIIIDGVTGRVEDINLTYVVVRTGEEGRLIVPTAKFLDTSFQNWNRRSGGLTGFVTLPIVPGHPVAPIREAFLRLLADQPDWDKRKSELQVAGVSAGVVELKLVLSAKDTTALNRLRLEMREAMLEWLRQNMPEALKTES